MEESKNMSAELRLIEDVVDTISEKLNDTAGLLELIRLGVERLNKEDESYEISSLRIVEEYLSSVNRIYLTKLRSMLSEMREQF